MKKIYFKTKSLFIDGRKQQGIVCPIPNSNNVKFVTFEGESFTVRDAKESEFKRTKISNELKVLADKLIKTLKDEYELALLQIKLEEEIRRTRRESWEINENFRTLSQEVKEFYKKEQGIVTLEDFNNLKSLVQDKNELEVDLKFCKTKDGIVSFKIEQVAEIGKYSVDRYSFMYEEYDHYYLCADNIEEYKDFQELAKKYFKRYSSKSNLVDNIDISYDAGQGDKYSLFIASYTEFTFKNPIKLTEKTLIKIKDLIKNLVISNVTF
ncbi:hypothetical protein BFS06_14195 [Clostridium perfringens]|uniref:Uncharacterized protein n=1 Tax=Clostridium perfringens TaxID=1502 RepID=A0A140GRH3_CLOPF|nr:hypothetical protein [Clostridium perfringens]AMN31132.1 hypothetical protein JFP838_pA0216 [Clostridium perfringens]TBX14357.1 hypothetical protein BFS06_14195 [Clostridium perfringens]